MGLSKIVKKADGKVVVVHQLDQDGKAYAETVIIETPEGVDPARISHLANQDGAVGVFSYTFSRYDTVPDVKFPEV